MSYNTGAKIVTDGLIYCVDAANIKSAISGSSAWVDMSGYGNNLVAGNLTTTTLVSGPTASWQFQALTDFTDFFYKAINSSSIFQVSSSYTAEAFCSAASASGGDNTFCIIRVGLGSDAIFMFALTPNNSTQQITSFGTQWYNQGFRGASSTALTIPFGQWNHYAVSNYFGIYKFYLNGVLLNTVDSTGNFFAYSNASATDVKIGGSGSNLQDYSGKIALIRIYNRALSATEILRNYSASKSRFPI